ncbi:MAG: Ig-like domain-containing protein, partial [Bacteroidota bacterium]|nr:Ig-like domain-containing protein [Bacteroidota bacterium]
MKYLLFILIANLSLPLMGQFSDDFSDGNFTDNPAWGGETDKFTVSTSNELQLFDDSESGDAYLSTQSEAIENASWEFLVKFDFNPSSANYTDVFLCSNTSDLSGNVDGYFVRLGNTDDEVSLYLQSGTTKTKIIDGIDDRLDNEPISVRVKVTRNNIGNWTLFSDTLGGTNYMTEGTVFDDTHISSFYFGVKSIFSSTRWDKMFFDDFIVTGDPFIDVISPEFNGYVILNDTAIQINFSEPMDATSSLDPMNYQISGGVGNPDALTFIAGSPDKIVISINEAFYPNQEYTVLYQNLKDLAGNPIESGSFSFAIVIIDPEDI